MANSNENSERKFCLRQMGFERRLNKEFYSMLQNQDLVDVCLSCEGVGVKLHRLILSVNSIYFKNLFASITNPWQYPIVILKDIPVDDLQAMIEFMYKGEVIVNESNLESLIKSSEALSIKNFNEVCVALKEKLLIERGERRQTSKILPRKTTGPKHCPDKTKKQTKKFQHHIREMESEKVYLPNIDLPKNHENKEKTTLNKSIERRTSSHTPATLSQTSTSTLSSSTKTYTKPTGNTNTNTNTSIQSSNYTFIKPSEITNRSPNFESKQNDNKKQIDCEAVKMKESPLDRLITLANDNFPKPIDLPDECIETSRSKLNQSIKFIDSTDEPLVTINFSGDNEKDNDLMSIDLSETDTTSEKSTTNNKIPTDHSYFKAKIGPKKLTKQNMTDKPGPLSKKMRLEEKKTSHAKKNESKQSSEDQNEEKLQQPFVRKTAFLRRYHLRKVVSKVTTSSASRGSSIAKSEKVKQKYKKNAKKS